MVLLDCALPIRQAFHALHEQASHPAAACYQASSVDPTISTAPPKALDQCCKPGWGPCASLGLQVACWRRHCAVLEKNVCTVPAFCSLPYGARHMPRARHDATRRDSCSQVVGMWAAGDCLSAALGRGHSHRAWHGVSIRLHTGAAPTMRQCCARLYSCSCALPLLQVLATRYLKTPAQTPAPACQPC